MALAPSRPWSRAWVIGHGGPYLYPYPALALAPPAALFELVDEPVQAPAGA
ncbi:hypothetical protein NW769_015461 [Fusarium oxysporum]|nr:hypothetical protein NW769_015461 [Fusarium oxysporum]